MIKIKSDYLYTFLAIASKLTNSFLVLKILSLILSSYEFINYLIFLNTSSVLQFIFTFGLVTGIIAEAKNKTIFIDYFLIIIISSSLLLILLIINYIYRFTEPAIILASLFIALKLISFSILNGKNKKKDFIFYCTFDSLLLILLIFCFNKLFANNGYVYAYFISSLITLIIFTVKLKKEIFNELKKTDPIKYFTIFFHKYKHYFYMSFFSAFIVPIANLYIRKLISNSSINELDIATILAGWRLNESFLMIVGTISSIYFIQKFSAIENKNSQVFSIKKNSFYFFLITLALPLLTLFFPNIIIWLLLNKTYTSGYIILSIIFASFSFRAYAYIMGLYLVINKKVLYFIYIETINSLFFVLFIKFMLNSQSLIIPLGFLLQSLVSLIMTRYLVHRAIS